MASDTDKKIAKEAAALREKNKEAAMRREIEQINRTTRS